MKILFLGCPHGDEKFLKTKLNVDVVIVAGDIGKADKARSLRMKYPNASTLSDKVTKKELKEMTEENVGNSERILKHFSKKPTYFIFGNADNTKEIIEKKNKKYGINVIPLEDRITSGMNIECKIIKLGNLKVAGVGYFAEKEWNKDFLGDPRHRAISEAKKEEKSRRFLSKLGKVDILVSHIPPYGFLDFVNNRIVPKSWNKKHAGSHAVLEYVKRNQPKYVICAHIHESCGESVIGKTKIFNVSGKTLILDL